MPLNPKEITREFLKISLVKYNIGLRPEATEEAARIADDPIIDIDPSAFSEDEE